MGKFRVEVKEVAREHFAQHYKSGDKATIKKIEVLLKELEEHPRTGTGKPEMLKGNLTGFWSRRLNQKDRLIYSIEDETVTVEVVSALGHYGEK